MELGQDLIEMGFDYTTMVFYPENGGTFVIVDVFIVVVVVVILWIHDTDTDTAPFLDSYYDL